MILLIRLCWCLWTWVIWFLKVIRVIFIKNVVDQIDCSEANKEFFVISLVNLLILVKYCLGLVLMSVIWWWIVFSWNWEKNKNWILLIWVFWHENRADDALHLADIARAEGASVIIVGQALGPNGEETPSSRHAAKVAQAIRDVFTEGDVRLWDESGSTQAVRRLCFTWNHPEPLRFRCGSAAVPRRVSLWSVAPSQGGPPGSGRTRRRGRGRLLEWGREHPPDARPTARRRLKRGRIPPSWGSCRSWSDPGSGSRPSTRSAAPATATTSARVADRKSVV